MKALPLFVFSATLSLTVPHLASAQARPEQTLSPYNVAAAKPASQISTFGSGIPSRAVDGDTDGNYDHGSVTHTESAVGAWWEVDLQQAASISSITVYNRTDCCNARLNNFNVQILDDNRVVVKQFVTSGVALPINSYAAGGSIGHYVRIQLNGNDFLSLTEVQVWGQPTIQ